MIDFLRDTSTILLRELLRYRRQRAFLLAQLLIPVFAVALIGPPIGNLRDDLDYVSWLATGLMMLTISSGAVGGGYTLLEDVQRGFLRPILVAPVARSAIVVGKILARLLLSLALVAGLGLVFALFTPLRLAHPLAALGALAAMTFGFVGLGIILATSLRRTESFRTIAALVTLPLYLLSGMFFPVAALPGPTRTLALLNPLTYGLDLFRYGLIHTHEFPLALSVAVVVGYAVITTVLGAHLFERRLAA